MSKFPDPSKESNQQPVEEAIDASKLDAKKYTPPPSTSAQPPIFQSNPNPMLSNPSQSTGLVPEPTKKGKTPKPPGAGSGALKRILSIILGLLLFGGIVYAVITYVLPMFLSDEPDPVTLTYWGLWEDASVMQETIAAYQRDNPHVTINYSLQSPTNYRTRLQSAIQQGSGPDIAKIHNTWLPMLVSNLAPAPENIIPQGELNNFYPVVREDLTLGGKTYALPFAIDGLALYYNKDIFTSAGITPPADWNELRKLAFDLTTRNPETGEITRSGIAMGTTGNVEHWSDILGLLILQNSGDPGKPDTDEVKDALSFYTVFSTQDKIWDDKQPNSIFAFATGTVAMILAPSWEMITIDSINPDLNYGIVESPKLATKKTAWATYWAEAVPSTSTNKEEAWKFIKYLTSKPALEKTFASATAQWGFGLPYPLVQMGENLSTNEMMYPFVSQAPNYESWYLASRTSDEGINDDIIKYYEDALNSINNGSSPNSIAKTLNSGVLQVLGRYPQAK